MHREIQIKQFPIVTTHWWPKTRNERFVWENEQYLYRFLPLVHNHVQVIWVRTHIRCVTCVHALWLTLHSHGASASTLDGGRVWSVVLTQLRGIFLLEDAHCHRSCRFWTVYSRIMMTSFKQTRLLSCIVFLYERSMYPFHSSVTSQTHMPQLHPPHPASLPPNHVKNNRSRNSLRHDTGEEKKKGILLWRRIRPWIIFVPFRN